MVGAGGSSSKSETETKTPEQKKWLTEALSLYGPKLGENENVWQGLRVSPLTDIQQQAITGAGNFAEYFGTPQYAGTPLFQETGEATRGLLTGETGAQKITEPQVNEYFTETLYNPAMRDLREDILPGIDESYAGPGFFGSARSHARQEAMQDTSELLAEQRAALNWNVLQRNQELDEARAARTLAAVPQGMAFGQVPAQEIQNNLQIAAQQIGGLNSIFGIGSAEQTQQQRELEAEITKFAEENEITDPENLNILLTLLGLNFSRSKSSASGWNFNILSGD